MTRVRFAPSPTGHLHVGGVRTALFNYVYAKKTGGKLILRIEDTDTVRSTRESEQLLLEDLEVMNLKADEGPLQGGPHKPYRQSERQEIFDKYVRQLLAEGRAYRCFCSPKMIEEKRELAIKSGQPPIYDGTCTKLSVEEVSRRIAAGEKAGVRFKAPHETIHFTDLVRGDMEFRAGTVGDFMITRSPERGGEEIGIPVYNFSCVVDDHLMELTHIIRGEDHLSNTARQIFLFQAFGWKVPEFAHLPMVVGMDRQKLSKRNGDAAAHDYLTKGYLPEALLNFLALLGWAPPTGTTFQSGHPEVFTIDEMIRVFDVSGLHRNPAAFDPEKLAWMNGFYIRSLSPSDLRKRAEPFLRGDSRWLERGEAWLEELLTLVRSEAVVLSDLPALAKFAIEQPAPEVPISSDAKPVLAAFVKMLPALDLKALGAQTGAKGKALYEPLRLAVLGKTHGPELMPILKLLGPAELQKRCEKYL